MKIAFDPLTFTVPLSWEAHSLAQKYRGEQISKQKSKQVYLNTLAIYAVDYYLKCLGFKPHSDRCESHNSIALRLKDVADLSVPQIGKLECRPVLPDAEVLQIPMEARVDRIAYLAVQLSPSLKQAEILGFTPTSVEQMPLADLQSLAEFPDFLCQVQQDAIATQLSPFHPQTTVNLGQWLEGVNNAGWQALDALLDTPKLVMVRANSQTANIQRAKLLDLGMQLGDQAIVLAITLTPGDNLTNTLVHLYPADGDRYLPVHLKLMMLSEAGEKMQEVESRSQDNSIQLKAFSGQTGDLFRIQVTLNDVSLTENFVF